MVINKLEKVSEEEFLCVINDAIAYYDSIILKHWKPLEKAQSSKFEFIDLYKRYIEAKKNSVLEFTLESDYLLDFKIIRKKEEISQVLWHRYH